ncbi:hypothetical protein BBJ28_00002523 [Nothophytophthora sp. Chile5]|nr:hypothetical protein BBJ28_00002523 [Nothophytophthora sp. Chile5]
MAPTDGSKAVAKSTKTREVHYMLLCEVALGKSSNLTAAAAWGEKPLLHDGTDSVKALANHTPDPNGVLVSPKCGAQLHVGRVKRVGSELPFERVWAKTDPSPQPSGRYERNPNFAANTQAYLDKLVSDKSFVVGNTHSVTDNDRALFIHYLYAQSTVTIEMMSRESPEASAGSTDGEEDGAGFATDHGAVGAWCEATVKVTIQPENSPSHSYFAKLYRNVLTRSPLAKDYTLAEPSLLEYAELVVYKEAQARLRYVVEVETVSR